MGRNLSQIPSSHTFRLHCHCKTNFRISYRHTDARDVLNTPERIMGRLKLCPLVWKCGKIGVSERKLFLKFSVECALCFFRPGQKFRRLSSERGTLQLPFSMSVLRAQVITALALLIVSTGYGGQNGSASARSTSLLQLLTTSRREAAEHHAHSTEHQAHAPLPIKVDYSIDSRGRDEVNKSNQHERILGNVDCL